MYLKNVCFHYFFHSNNKRNVVDESKSETLGTVLSLIPSHCIFVQLQALKLNNDMHTYSFLPGAIQKIKECLYNILCGQVN